MPRKKEGQKSGARGSLREADAPACSPTLLRARRKGRGQHPASGGTPCRVRQFPVDCPAGRAALLAEGPSHEGLLVAPVQDALEPAVQRDPRRRARPGAAVVQRSVGRGAAGGRRARARETLRETDEFAVARDAAWTTVDVALDAAAESWLSERQAFGCAAPTKVDALAELAGSGATQLLAYWPEQSHRQLLWLLNADLRRRSAVHSGGSS